jgi:hypothetical protein
MSKHRVLSFKPQLRLEWRGQDGQNETEQPDHSASLGDSITSSTRIRFSVHTPIYGIRRINGIRRRFHSVTAESAISRFGAASFTARMRLPTCCYRWPPWRSSDRDRDRFRDLCKRRRLRMKSAEASGSHPGFRTRMSRSDARSVWRLISRQV